ncbi:MAG: MFS transporter [Planctomycetaceae bacterium]
MENSWSTRFDGVSRDAGCLFLTRGLRMFAYGLLSVVLALFLEQAGFSSWQIGWVLSGALAGDIVVSLWFATRADRLGRRRLLVASALLMAAAGGVFAVSRNFAVLLAAATIGVISPSDKEVGPFLSIEQASLAQIVPAARRTAVFAWYHLVGGLLAALGLLCGGALVEFAQARTQSPVDAYVPVLVIYAAVGLIMAALFTRLSPAVEPAAGGASQPRREGAQADWHGLHRSKRIVALLSALFTLDAFAGGFILQSLVAYWLHRRFAVEPESLGEIFAVASLLAGLSALAAGRLAQRFGLVNTMVFTHLPSNVLLLLIPLATDVRWAVGLWLARCLISEMDVPTRQALTMHLVAPDERSAAAGITAVARSVGRSASALPAAWLVGSATFSGLPFLLAGGLKIVYDLLLWGAMRREEQGRGRDAETKI